MHHRSNDMGLAARTTIAWTAVLLGCSAPEDDATPAADTGTSSPTTSDPEMSSVGSTSSADGATTSGADMPSSSTGGESGSSGEPVDPAAPDWVDDLPVGVWVPISENTLSDVDPEDDPNVNPNFIDDNGDGRSEASAPWRGTSGQMCVLACWNGAAFADAYGESGALLVYGGGHRGYDGSEVYGFDMATRLWERVTDPWPGTDFDPEYGIYPDGSPLPPHTYDGVGYDPELHAFVVMRGVSDPEQGTKTANLHVAHLLDLETKEWRRSPFNPDGANMHGAGSAYDRNRGVFWQLGCYGTALTAFDARTDNGDGTWGSYANFANDPTPISNGVGIDPRHDLLVYTRFSGSDELRARRLDDPDSSEFVLEQSGELPIKRSANGWEWSDRVDGFVYWSAGTPDVYAFTKDDDDPEDLAWTWTNLTHPSNTENPEKAENDSGSYSRFQVAEYGDVSVAITVNTIHGPVWAFRLPSEP